MRRTVLMALFAALLLVPTTTAHAQGREDILRDCADDGILEESYSASKLRDARNNIPAELDEYSDCRDVLSREISAKTKTSTSNSGGTDNSGGGGTGGGGGGTGGSTDTPAPTTTDEPAPTATPSGRDPGIQIGPSTPEDFKALEGANRYANEPIEVNGRPITPAASVGRNGLPGTLIAVLALIAVAALSMVVPFARRRVVTRPTP
ncbi:hypothetical protein OJ997_19495 [Solirubrobacter phytolaccae]|uniref:Uncharacterized protein n=1 Tax=Solirubrobacter phytolaccae TaxID=1404360 RepID=A0A9X3N9U1_9ACTN|nr:hypothetical protein [Solirubrobacter phytolaccae]MDA0182503.1 hypothetical protein [Solirubrobacter phytolaccae]